MTTIIQDRLAVLDRITLHQGPHKPGTPVPPEQLQACALEAAAWIAGEPWGDHPECVCPVIATFVRSWNDDIRSDETRTRLLRPLIPLMVGTRESKVTEQRRAWLIVDWEMRVRVPAFLRLVTALESHAKALESLPEIVDLDGLQAALEMAQVAQSDAYAATAVDAAESDVGNATMNAAGDSVWEAAWGAVRNAAGDSAWRAVRNAAWDAAWYAAWKASRSKLDLTVTEMQASAQGLVRRMCTLGREEER